MDKDYRQQIEAMLDRFLELYLGQKTYRGHGNKEYYRWRDYDETVHSGRHYLSVKNSSHNGEKEIDVTINSEAISIFPYSGEGLLPINVKMALKGMQQKLAQSSLVDGLTLQPGNKPILTFSLTDTYESVLELKRVYREAVVEQAVELFEKDGNDQRAIALLKSHSSAHTYSEMEKMFDRKVGDPDLSIGIL